MKKLEVPNEALASKCEILPSLHDGGGSIKVMLNEKQIAVADIHIHKRFIKINKLGVDNEYRQQGIGTALMQWIMDWCESNKIFAATVHASSGISEELVELGISKGLPQNKLLDFYRGFGFTEENGNWLHKDFKTFSLYKGKDVFWDKP